MRSSSPSFFTVTTGSSEPIYRQLVGQVERLVAGGQLAAGDELPSVREVPRAQRELVAWSLLTRPDDRPPRDSR